MRASSSDPGFRKYLIALERYPTLDRERELALSRAFRSGDEKAGDLLVSCNLRHVVRIARRYRGYGFHPSELVAEGNVGLLQAVRRFEPERGLRFMTYASYWVRAHVLSFVLRNWSLVGVGTGPVQSKLFFRLHCEKAKLAAVMGEGVDLTAHLARKFGCTKEHIRRMEERIDGRDLSLDAKAHRDGRGSIMDTLLVGQPEQEAALAVSEVCGLVRDRVADALERLDVREQVIVRRRLLGAHKETLSELGRELGVSRERVRQLEQRVKLKLRRTFADLSPEHAPRLRQAA